VSYTLDIGDDVQEQIAALVGTLGMVTYLIVEDRQEVQLLIITWAG
jgi:hypothetical protein